MVVSKQQKIGFLLLTQDIVLYKLRPTNNKRAYFEISFLINQPKHMLCVLKETVLLSTQNKF